MAQYKPPQGVYFLYSNAELVYVGKTNDIYRRISEHSRGMVKPGQEPKKFDDWKYIECDNEDMRTLLEGLVIDYAHPKYNNAPCYEKFDTDSITENWSHRSNVRPQDLIEYLVSKGMVN